MAPSASSPDERESATKRELLAFARQLRKDQTDAEQFLWRLLRNRRTGFKFRRQHPIEPYVLDFYCHEQQLAVELDGHQHGRGDGPTYDARRSQFLARKGIRVLRFSNRDVFLRTEAVVLTIWRELRGIDALPGKHAHEAPDASAAESSSAQPSPPTPLPRGEGSRWLASLVALLMLLALAPGVAQSSPDDDPAELGSAFRELVDTYWTATDRKVRDAALGDLERIFKDDPAGAYGAILDWGGGYADAPELKTGPVDTTLAVVIPESPTETIDVALYIPTRYSPRRRWPLVAVLPGADETLDETREAWQTIAEAEGFIVVVPADPNGDRDPEWSYSIADRERQAVLQALAMAGREYRIDTGRVFATGAGRGGFGCWDLALHAPGVFRAIHPVGGAPGLLPLRLSANLAATRIRCVLGDKDDPLVIHNVNIAQRMVSPIGAPIDIVLHPGADADVEVDPLEIWRFLRDAADADDERATGRIHSVLDETATELRPWQHLGLRVTRVDKSEVALPETIDIPGASQMSEMRRRDAVADALQIYRAKVDVRWVGTTATITTEHVDRLSLLLDPRALAPTLTEALELDRVTLVINGRRPKVERFRWSLRTLLDAMLARPTSPVRPLAVINLRP